MPLLIAAFMVLWTTVRHELLHAAGALATGTRVDAIRVLPGVDPEIGFFMGYVRYGSDVSWVVHGAPFIGDVALLALAWWALRGVTRPWARRAVIVAMVLSALVDLSFAYVSGLGREASDLNDLFDAFPNVFVHMFFVAAIAAGVILLRRPPEPVGTVSDRRGLPGQPWHRRRPPPGPHLRGRPRG